MRQVLLVVSATLPRGRVDAVGGPRKDYTALARALDATVLDRRAVHHSVAGRLIARLVGLPVAQAWFAFLRSRDYNVIVTDGEHIGIPLALLLKLGGATTPHVTIGHRLSAPKKRPFFRWLRAHTHMTRILLHSKLQYDHAVAELGIPADRLMLVPFQVDTDFWRPLPVAEERLISSAGLEHRDYPTLFRAVDGLDARVVIGAASHWSRQPNTAGGARQPNVEVGAFDYPSLRDLYARSALVVVPLDDTDFQAGVTTVLEAMAMGKAVVVTHSRGQTDIVEDRRAVTRGTPPRPRPASLLREVAATAGVELEPNGFYVPPNDTDALRRAIVYLLDHPAERARLGVAGRRGRAPADARSVRRADPGARRAGRRAAGTRARSGRGVHRDARSAPRRSDVIAHLAMMERGVECSRTRARARDAGAPGRDPTGAGTVVVIGC